MFSGWILTIFGGFAGLGIFGESLGLNDVMDGALRMSRELTAICLCAFLSVLWGLLDDKKPMKAGVKFAGQLFIAIGIVVGGGIRLSCFIDSPVLTSVLTVLWMLFILNAINFFDNMDGLAVGTAAIAFLFFTIAAGINGQYLVAALGACSCAASCGFWLYNKNPASIFMGDSGSHFLAFLLGIISAKVTYYSPEIDSTRFAVLLPLFILAVPIFDAFAVVVIRLHNHKPIYKGDHNHISHRFLHLGMSRKRAVQAVHLLVLVSCLGALPLLWCDLKTCIVLIVQGLTILLLLTVVQMASRHESGDCSAVNVLKKEQP